MPKIKICGVTTADDARMVAELGADAIGLNFYERSPRYLSPGKAIAVMRAIPAFTSTVGVFVNEPLRRATALAFQLSLRAIQTVDDEPQSGDAFPFAHIPAFRIANQKDVTLAQLFCQTHHPSAVLIDARVPGQMGGTGVTVDWSLLAGIDFSAPLILAGGLTPENVAEAIEKVRPWAVDVASGVESSPGVKDAKKVTAFVEAVKKVKGPI